MTTIIPEQPTFSVCPACLEGLVFVQTGTTRDPEARVYECPKCKQREYMHPEAHNATPEQCLHNNNTSANVRIDYLEDTGRYMCEVTLKCQDCGHPFRFQGLPLGLNMNGATMAVDGLTARLAIMPADRIPHPLAGFSGFGVKVS